MPMNPRRTGLEEEPDCPATDWLAAARPATDAVDAFRKSLRLSSSPIAFPFGSSEFTWIMAFVRSIHFLRPRAGRLSDVAEADVDYI